MNTNQPAPDFRQADSLGMPRVATVQALLGSDLLFVSIRVHSRLLDVAGSGVADRDDAQQLVHGGLARPDFFPTGLRQRAHAFVLGGAGELTG
jgi:hypothetical protein